MDIRDWHRLTFNEIPVYVLPDGPDWILPNPGGDKLIQTLMNAPPTTGDNGDILSHARDQQFYNELIHPLGQDRYPGRGALLELARLKECWFHITDKCNLACRHCMFSCSPADTATMALEDFTCFFLQAFDLGARTFFLTGGEPMVHPDFKEICARVLDRSPDTCLVILTNGLLIDTFLSFLNTLPQERIHFQISLDGEKTTHDWIRGKGTYERVLKGLEGLTAINHQVSLAMAVSRDNLDEMPGLVDVAARYAISNIHYLWMFARGNSEQNRPLTSRKVFIRLKAAHEKAIKQGISIDNIDTIERQVFSPRGTKYDLGTAGWESLAIGPGGNVYPTPALVREPQALCGNIRDGLGKVWRGSLLLSQIRGLSIVGEPLLTDDPLKFLTGGGDLDHSFYHSGLFAGHDPYMNLYGHIALWLITRSPKQGQGTDIPWPCVCMRMGDRLLNCDDTHGQVALTHSNCVLSLGSLTGSVSGFYARAAEDTNQDIVNPVCYPEEEIFHVPPTARIRSYGCGSPVLDAGVSPGETLVDLGSGAGMECFIAARKVGRKGRVFGIDMTDSMLALAEKSLGPVETALGYRNVQFKKALLENLGLPDAGTDIVISNCVINLSSDKHRTFGEIFRVLKPGGRLVISDIVTDTPPEPTILNDPLLRGECIAGALTLTRLMALLEIAGFENIRIFKRFFYRQVMGHCFYSVTYQAYKPSRQGEMEDPKEIIYPGPFAAVMTDKGEVLLRGEKKKMAWQEIADDPVFILDSKGNAANIEAENSCACYLPPEAESDSSVVALDFSKKKRAGCMECGKPLQYFSENKPLACSHCGLVKSANAMCEAGHFICDTCHSKDALTIVTDICVNTSETDMIKILNTIRNHPVMPLHGPEHHFAVPGAIVAAYKNAGGNATREKIYAAIERGKAIPGGSCGFWGGCGAALGVGIAFGVILESNPIDPGPRQMVQQVAGKIILELSRVEASRCCQREAWTAMLIASDLSQTLLPIVLRVDDTLVCTQGHNKECPGGTCRFF